MHFALFHHVVEVDMIACFVCIVFEKTCKNV